MEAAPRRGGPRRLGFAAVVVAGLLAAGLPVEARPAGVPVESGAAPDGGAAPEAAVDALLRPPAAHPVLPADPEGALAEAVVRLGSALGVTLDPAPRIAAARLPGPVTGRLALLVAALSECHAAAAPARAQLADPAVAAALRPGGEGRATGLAASPSLVATAGALRACASRLHGLAREARGVLAATAETTAENSQALDLWPVLSYAPGAEGQRYLHDYVLLVDGAGDDVYLNNAGGNFLDLKRGPEGSPALEHGRAHGCHQLNADVPDGECVPGVALLVDMAGNDTYGGLEEPDPADDAFCTDDLVVRRVVLGGAALAGVGVLLDSAGDDHYLGKTVAQGAGHLAGVGLLVDELGDDSYLAIRNAQGFGLLGGLGLLSDEAGDDVYDRYLPRALDPTAPFQRRGAGGVLDDRGSCDPLARQLQGSGFLGGVGILVDGAGDDLYRGPGPAVQQFDPNIQFPHGSQGYGNLGGVGLFLDEGGTDTYHGVPGRDDETTVEPGPESSGLFRDTGS